MRKKLFGNNIEPDCMYCENAVFNKYDVFCKKSKGIRNGRCRPFKYDPLMREPKSISLRGNYTAEDFRL